MDLSHARKYSLLEIERIVSNIHAQHFANGITIPIDIDFIAESHPAVDCIKPIPMLEDKFNVAAVLFKKPDGLIDILVDEDTYTYQRARASFSIAHEFGHIVLHSQILERCQTIEHVLELNQKIKTRYHHIEKSANQCAGAFLMPRSTLIQHTIAVYNVFVKVHGFDPDLIINKIVSELAKRYKVSPESMKIRLGEVELIQKIMESLRYQMHYLDG